MIVKETWLYKSTKRRDSMTQQDVVKELNQQVANWTVAYTKLHNFHWYVKGLISSHYMKNLKNYTMKLVNM